jgi:hypothetical protein
VEEVAGEEHEIDVLLQSLFDDVQERLAEVVEAFLGAVLLVAEVDVGGVEKGKRHRIASSIYLTS